MARKKKHATRSRSRKHQEREERGKRRHSHGQPGRGNKPQAPRRTFKGRIQKNPKGFAFVISEDPLVDDCYISREEAMALMDGDVISYRVHKQGNRFNAEVVNIEKRGQKEVLGRFQRQGHHDFIETVDGNIHMVENPPLRLCQGEYVIGKIVKYPTHKDYGTVVIDQVLGKNLLPKHDLLITVSRFGLPHEFSESALESARQSRQWGEKELQHPSPGRKDMRAMPFVTVDGEDAKDFDDAILVEEVKSGKTAFILYVAIADVSFFVRQETPLDASAVERSTSVYFPGVCIPMLPEDLSNDLCSLRPKEDKLTLVAEMHVDSSGTVFESKFYEGIIRTARRMTYTELQAFFDKDPNTLEAVKFLEAPLKAAQKLFHIFLKRRQDRGVLDFQLPECRIEVDKEGVPIGVKRAPSWDAHRLIEEFMVAANSAVAKELKEKDVPALYRVHEAPAPETVDEINQLMKSLGINERIEMVHPKDFSRILRATAEIKGAKTLHQAILRMQKQARYQPDPLGHFGLSLSDYCHFTSPIRRYPDLVVHRALKQVIQRGKNTEKKGETALLPMEQLGEKTSACERRAMEAERFIVKRKACWFMKERLGEVYQGEIAGVVSRGLFVEIPEFGIDGFVSIESLHGFYEFDDRRKCLRKRPGHTVLGVGDPLKIRVARVVVEDNEIEFQEEE